MTYRHCHVDSGPDRTDENMDRRTVDACLAALDATEAHTVDLTGGAPELNPHFRYLVEACARRGKHIIDRCNLTVLLLPRNRDLPRSFWLTMGLRSCVHCPTIERAIRMHRGVMGPTRNPSKPLKRLNAVGTVQATHTGGSLSCLIPQAHFSQTKPSWNENGRPL